MGYTIAIAGKGGTGKTTITALLIRLLREKGEVSVLAVDADPNSNLAEALGVSAGKSIGEVLDEISKNPQAIPSGMSKDRFLEYQIQTILQEADGFDLLTMGTPEGPGCYCYVNNVLRNTMARLISNYRYIIIDNEAGLEHLSRRTTRSADVLLVVSDATPVGLKAAQRIGNLVDELDIKTQKKLLLINRYGQNIDKTKIRDLALAYIGNIPQDKQLENLSLNGNSLFELEVNALSISALRKIGENIWQKG